MHKLRVALLAALCAGAVAGCNTNTSPGNIVAGKVAMQLAVGTLNDSAGTLTGAARYISKCGGDIPWSVRGVGVSEYRQRDAHRSRRNHRLNARHLQLRASTWHEWRWRIPARVHAGQRKWCRLRYWLHLDWCPTNRRQLRNQNGGFSQRTKPNLWGGRNSSGDADRSRQRSGAILRLWRSYRGRDLYGLGPGGSHRNARRCSPRYLGGCDGKDHRHDCDAPQ